MASRYSELYRLPSRLYLDEAPVIIEAGALLKDTQTNQVIAQFKIKNLSEKKLIACKISVDAFEPSGKKLDGIEDFSYLDISAEIGKEFGSKVPVYLPDNTTRKISPAVTEVVFNDESIWTSKSQEWTVVAEQRSLKDKFENDETVKQFRIETGSDCSYYPELTRGLFLCGCGTMNLESSGKCSKCGRTFNDFVSALDEDSLNEKRDARLQREKEAREERERVAAQAAEEARLKEEARKKEKRKKLP